MISSEVRLRMPICGEVALLIEQSINDVALPDGHAPPGISLPLSRLHVHNRL